MLHEVILLSYVSLVLSLHTKLLTFI